MVRETHFIRKYSNYLGIAINLVLYILKQLLTQGDYIPIQLLIRPGFSVARLKVS